MPTLWITYAWADDLDADVQFVAGQLTQALDVKLDKWMLGAGQRLWTQIERSISDPQQSDAWAVYATENSLRSQACQEELAYALDRALRQRTSEFPLIGIFPGKISEELVPATIRTRLYVSTTDPDWKERVISATEKRSPNISKPSIEPFSWKVHESPNGRILELRPRVGSWLPMIVAVPLAEQNRIRSVIYGPRNTATLAPPSGFISYSLPPGTDGSGKYWVWSLGHEITPTVSCYVLLNDTPSQIIFGAPSEPHYTIKFS